MLGSTSGKNNDNTGGTFKEVEFQKAYMAEKEKKHIQREL